LWRSADKLKPNSSKRRRPSPSPVTTRNANLHWQLYERGREAGEKNSGLAEVNQTIARLTSDKAALDGQLADQRDRRWLDLGQIWLALNCSTLSAEWFREVQGTFVQNEICEHQ
jgi:hypothetical protein